MKRELEQLSKTISHALRHAPEIYGIKLNAEGWVGMQELTTALTAKGFKDVTQASIEELIALSAKKRFDVSNGRIRAYYGHSTEEKIVKQEVEPPVILYHGTQQDVAYIILQEGLKPMGRQYVHLSENTNIAKEVARRRKGDIVILTVKALEAYKSGIAFYKEENGVWLAEHILAQFISI